MNEINATTEAAHPTAKPGRTALCPYCGHVSSQPHSCERCKGLFEPLSRQASQNAMGPWFIRDEANPFKPGCNYATLKMLIAKGRVQPDSIMRGPGSRQFWMYARTIPGVAPLLGFCHACQQPVRPDYTECKYCGIEFRTQEDRQFLGLAPIRLLPGQGTPEEVARQALNPVQDEHEEGQQEVSYEVATPPPIPEAAPVAQEERRQFQSTRVDAARSEIARSLLAERRKSAAASKRMVIIGVLIGLAVFGLFLAILAAMPNATMTTATPAAAPAPSQAPTSIPSPPQAPPR